MVEEGVNGYLVEPGDSARLAERLDALLSDPERCRAFGERGRALAAERYTWDRVGLRMETHIRQALAAYDAAT